MSRFRKLSQTLWHCQYHIIWCPKYRFRILEGQIAKAVEGFIRAFSEQQECEIIELNVQPDHVHMLVMIPPKIVVSLIHGKGQGAHRHSDSEPLQEAEAENPIWVIIFGLRGIVWIPWASTLRRSASI